LALVATALVATACSDDAPDPAAEHRDRVRARLEETYTPTQVTCLVGALRTSDVDALVAGKDLAIDGEVMQHYDAALRRCVLGTEETTTTGPTTTGRSTTTTAAPTTTTAATATTAP
jgi:hypothetical protein